LPFSQAAATDDWLPGAAFEELLLLLDVRQHLYPLPAFSGIPPAVGFSCEEHEHFFSNEGHTLWNPHLYAYVSHYRWQDGGSRGEHLAKMRVNTAFHSFFEPPVAGRLTGGGCLLPWISSCELDPTPPSEATRSDTDAYLVHFRRKEGIEAVPHEAPALIVAVSLESPQNEVYQQPHTHTMGYFWDAEVFSTYAWAIADHATEFVPLADRRAGLLWVASNCIPWRTMAVRQLMTHVSVDSFGQCLKNQDREVQTDDWPRYLFHLAWENSLCEDYITEKFWRPFRAGAVPVYMGAANALDYAPTTHSVIPLRAFRHISAFVDVLQLLQADPELTRYYLAQHLSPVHLRRGYLFYQYRSTPSCDVKERVCNLVGQNLPLIHAARKSNTPIAHSPHHRDFSCNVDLQSSFPSQFFTSLPTLAAASSRRRPSRGSSFHHPDFHPKKPPS
jgi:hypothetical protein